MAQQDVTQQIEDYWSGRLSASERETLEQQVAAQADLADEFKAYGQLFQGFAALQEEHLREKMQLWNNTWSEQDDTELIEAYVQGQLNERMTQELDTRQQQDPAFAQAVVQQRLLEKSLDAARQEQFSAKIQGWAQQATDREGEEQEDEIKPSGSSPKIVRMQWRKWVAAAAVLLVLLLAVQLVIQPNYTDAALAEAMYEAPRSATTMGSTETPASSPFLEEFKRAHRLLAQGDYGAADASFQRLQDQLASLEMDDFTKTYYADNLSWNELLAELGASQTDQNFQNKVEQMAADPDHTYQTEAAKLLRKLNSIWR